MTLRYSWRSFRRVGCGNPASRSGRSCTNRTEWMERRHEDALRDALEKVMLEGAVTLRWAQLYLWFGAERLAKGSYREILRTWEEVCKAAKRDVAQLHALRKKKGTPYELTLMRGPFKDEKLDLFQTWVEGE